MTLTSSEIAPLFGCFQSTGYMTAPGAFRECYFVDKKTPNLRPIHPFRPHSNLSSARHAPSLCCVENAISNPRLTWSTLPLTVQDERIPGLRIIDQLLKTFQDAFARGRLEGEIINYHHNVARFETEIFFTKKICDINTRTPSRQNRGSYAPTNTSLIFCASFAHPFNGLSDPW